MCVFTCAYNRQKLRGDVFGGGLLQMWSVDVKNLSNAGKLRSRLRDGRGVVSNDHEDVFNRRLTKRPHDAGQEGVAAW